MIQFSSDQGSSENYETAHLLQQQQSYSILLLCSFRCSFYLCHVFSLLFRSGSFPTAPPELGQDQGHPGAEQSPNGARIWGWRCQLPGKNSGAPRTSAPGQDTHHALHLILKGILIPRLATPLTPKFEVDCTAKPLKCIMI